MQKLTTFLGIHTTIQTHTFVTMKELYCRYLNAGGTLSGREFAVEVRHLLGSTSAVEHRKRLDCFTGVRLRELREIIRQAQPVDPPTTTAAAFRVAKR